MAEVHRVDFAKGRPVPERQPRRRLANDLLLHRLRRIEAGYRELAAASAELTALLEARAARKG